jgi:hypothetical protein
MFWGQCEASLLDITTFIQHKAFMKLIPTRSLAANSGLVMKQLEDEGVLVVTKDGRPRSIMLSTSEGTLMDDLRDCLYLRARKALKEAQLHSRSKGLDRLTPEEIEAEIQAVRSSQG